jgi:hypothetical protein
MNTLAFLVLLVIGTTVWVGVDCHVHRDETGRSTVGWVIFCALFWIVAFPAYLALRSKPARQPVWNDETDEIEWE